MINYKNFLLSPAGGAWRESEINVLISPSKIKLLIAQLDLMVAEYSLCIFGGHGGHDTTTDTTIININSTEKINVNELNSGANRHTVIIDSCRTHFAEVIVEAMRKAKASMESLAEKDIARRRFDDHLANCPKGIAKMYSCSDDEGAGDNSKGGVFSYALLRNCRNWSAQISFGNNVLDVQEAFNLAEAAVKHQTGSRQNPEGYFNRTGPRFPFSIRT